MSRLQQAKEFLKNYLPESIVDVGRSLRTGAKKGEAVTRAQAGPQGTSRTSVFGPEFNRLMREGGVVEVKGSFDPRTGLPETRRIEAAANAAEMAGAYLNRALVDIGSDSSRRFYWQYNHPMPIAEKIAEKVAPGLKGVTNPTEKAMLGLAIAAPVAASAGTFDLTNPGEQFRPKGYAQKYSEKSSEDRRETAQPGIELIDRIVLGRQGNPLKYETAKQEIPDLTKERYSKVMRNYYQDKGLLGLGLIKATDENIQGVPEARIVGFPVGLQAAGALAGGAATARQTVGKPGISNRRAAAITAAGSLAGATVGNIINRGIAAARNNPESLPDTLEYLG